MNIVLYLSDIVFILISVIMFIKTIFFYKHIPYSIYKEFLPKGEYIYQKDFTEGTFSKEICMFSHNK